MFRGREMAHPERGEALLRKLADEIAEFGTIEQQPNQEGRNMTMVMAPVRGAIGRQEGSRTTSRQESSRRPRAAARRRRRSPPRRAARGRAPPHSRRGSPLARSAGGAAPLPTPTGLTPEQELKLCNRATDRHGI